jgi:hypothetical protein
VTKLYAQALSYIAIDPDQMKNSLEWIISQQSKDGKFPEIGRIVDTFIKVTLLDLVKVCVLDCVFRVDWKETHLELHLFLYLYWKLRKL